MFPDCWLSTLKKLLTKIIISFTFWVSHWFITRCLSHQRGVLIQRKSVLFVVIRNFPFRVSSLSWNWIWAHILTELIGFYDQNWFVAHLLHLRNYHWGVSHWIAVVYGLICCPAVIHTKVSLSEVVFHNLWSVLATK